MRYLLRDVWRDQGLRTLGWALLAVLFLRYLYGCGSALQQAASTQAEIIVRSRPARVEWYESEHERCLMAARPRLPGERMGYYLECMRPAEAVARTADSYRDVLHAAQAAIRIGDGAEAIPCVIEAARDLLRSAESAGAPLPAEVREIAAMVPEGLCHE